MKPLMLLVLAAMMTSTATADVQRPHVHDRYEIIITADVVAGLGVDIQQLGWLCSVTYDPVMPDSDEFDEDDLVAAYVAVSCSGPGTILFSQGTPATVDPFTNQAADACTIVEDFETAGASSTTRYVIAGYLVTFDDDSPDLDKCSAQLIISNNDTGEEWSVVAPIVIYNDDSQPQPSTFELAFNMTGAELLPLLLAALVCMGLTLATARHEIRVGAAVALFLIGVVFVILGATAAVLFGVLFSLVAALALLFESLLWTSSRKKGPRKFFD